MDLSAVVRRYAAEGTGQLVLKFAETPHLCKIAIEDGEAVYIRLGLLDPQQTLEFILGKTPLEASFIKGVRSRHRLDAPITAALLQQGGSSTTTAETVTSTQAGSGGILMGSQVDQMLSAYVDIVGPLGVVMAEKYLQQIGYHRGDSIKSESFRFLLNQLLMDVPANLREQFLSACR